MDTFLPVAVLRLLSLESEEKPSANKLFIILNIIIVILVTGGLYFVLRRNLIAEWHFTSPISLFQLFLQDF